jgi:hypothetical protein
LSNKARVCGPCLLWARRMKNVCKILFCVCLGLGSTGAFAQEVLRYQLGGVRPGQAISVEVKWENHGSVREFVGQIDRGEDDLVLYSHPARVMPGESAAFRVGGIVPRWLGERRLPVTVVDSLGMKLQIVLELTVYSQIEPYGEVVDLGIAEVGGGGPTPRRVELTTFGAESVELNIIRDEGDLVDVNLDLSGSVFELAPKLDLPWGLHRGWLKFYTGTSSQPHYWVPYQFESRGSVVPITYEINAGLRSGKDGGPVEFTLEDKTLRELQIEDVEVSGTKLKWSLVDCPTRSPSCRILSLRDFEFGAIGQFESAVTVKFSNYDHVLPLRVFGIYAPDEAVKAFSANEASEANVGLSNSARSLEQQLQIISRSSVPIILPQPLGEGPLLRWRVAHDQGYAGYIVLRSRDGVSFSEVSGMIKSLRVEAGTPVEYSWRDEPRSRGLATYYRVDGIRRNGTRSTIVPPTLSGRGS